MENIIEQSRLIRFEIDSYVGSSKHQLTISWYCAEHVYILQCDIKAGHEKQKRLCSFQDIKGCSPELVTLTRHDKARGEDRTMRNPEKLIPLLSTVLIECDKRGEFNFYQCKTVRLEKKNKKA